MLVFQKVAKDNDWLSNVLWIDKTHFKIQEYVNTHNCRIWETKNHRTFVETLLLDAKDAVWCGFTLSTLIKNFSLQESLHSGFVIVSVTEEELFRYKHNHNIRSLADKRLLENTIFMQHGAPIPYLEV